MTVPGFQTLMLPFLKAVNDGQDHTLDEIIDKLTIEFALTETDLNELLPSGTTTKFRNRTGWARTYLKKAGLLDNPTRGKFRITQRGKTVLQSNPKEINTDFLARFPEFVEFKKATRQENKQDTTEGGISGDTASDVP